MAVRSGREMPHFELNMHVGFGNQRADFSVRLENDLPRYELSPDEYSEEQGASLYFREKPEDKADGAQKPAVTSGHADFYHRPTW
jgi:hypothetical protein